MEERTIFTSLTEGFIKREKDRIYILLEEMTGGRAKQVLELADDHKKLASLQEELKKNYTESKAVE